MPVGGTVVMTQAHDESAVCRQLASGQLPCLADLPLSTSAPVHEIPFQQTRDPNNHVTIAIDVTEGLQSVPAGPEMMRGVRASSIRMESTSSMMQKLKPRSTRLALLPVRLSLK